ncbi:zinc finger protein 740-like, partial [Sitodiplosis mosellana]|uniref:zinc finger protein 740-like n=1 Tax=Sitodiplosis mosellana TaxID=263140 RepID=UPI0024448974
NQLNRPVEVKEEPQIKEEPQSVGELIDVPVPSWNNRGVVLVLGVDQSNGEYDFDDIDCDVKIEVKKEVEEKKEEASKSNADSGEDAEGNQHDLQQPKHQNEDDILPQVSGHGATKPKVCKVGDPKNVSKKHKCDQCEYSTDHKSHFNQHLLIHTGEKPHGCDLCPKRFTSKQYLRAHMKVHVEQFLFYCPGCLKGFDGKDEKAAHE